MDTNATEWHELKKCVIESNVFIFCCRSHRQTPTSKIQSCHLLCAKDRVCIRVIVYGDDNAGVCRYDGCVCFLCKWRFVFPNSYNQSVCFQLSGRSLLLYINCENGIQLFENCELKQKQKPKANEQKKTQRKSKQLQTFRDVFFLFLSKMYVWYWVFCV